MKDSLFDTKALSAVNSPEQLDQHIKIIRCSNWVIIAGILAVVIAILYWCFFGNITNSMSVKGIIFPRSGVSNIVARCEGLVSGVLVKEGEYVENGQIIMNTSDEQIIDSIIAAKNELLLDSNNTQLIAEYNRLLMLYENTSIIKSDTSGIIQSIAAKNDSVVPGQPICSIINDNTSVNNKELIIYVPYSISEKFKTGMEAQISPVYAPREEFGFIRGYITSVGKIPVTPESFLNTFGTEEYIKDLISDDNVVEVRVMMVIDSNSQNSFSWSNPKGETLNINTGTICNVLIIFDNIRPVELLFRG